jgi:DNA-binding NarL/FixJ family response regulator
MPRKDGIEVMREFGHDGFAPRVVVLTAAHDDDVIEAIRLGAKGVVLKETATRLLLRCVREVHAGRKWLERSVAMQTVDVLLHRADTTRTVGASLTPRELEVARFVAAGLRSKAVAAKLAISEGTAKLHLHNAYRKLGVNGRVALALYMHGRGLS